LDGTTKEGVAATFSDGTLTSLDGVTWTSRIAADPGTNFSSCAIYNAKIYQARGGGTCRQNVLTGASNEIDLSNAGGGTAPTNCGVVLAHADRLILMGCTTAPHQWFASAVGDATNWDYADITSGGAFTNTGPDGGLLSEAITAGLSHDQNHLLIGCTNSIYYSRGNPRIGGTASLSSVIGPLMQSAWCQDDRGNSWMMTRLGLYFIPAGAPSPPQEASLNIPNDLVGFDPSVGDRVAIGYDVRWNGIHIFCNPNSGSDVNYFYHIPTKSFWPQTFANSIDLAITFPKLMTDDKSALLPVTTGGTVNQFDRTVTSVQESFSSELWLGPIFLGPPYGEGILHSLAIALTTDSDVVDWSVHVGQSVEEALAATAIFNGTQWTIDGLNYQQHPRARGHVAFIKIFDVSNRPWIYEQLLATIQPASQRRVI
jgi:hypothetical protein